MPLTRTTLAGGCAATDTEVLLTSIAGLALSNNINVDGEVMRATSVPAVATTPVGVFRGIRGSAVAAHVAGATAVFGPPSDFATIVRPPRREVVSYSVAGLIANPNPGTNKYVSLNGATLMAMTLANPAKENDGDLLVVISGGKAAHTITYTSAGLGGRGATTITFSTVAQMAVAFVASNEVWVLFGGSSGAGAVAAATVIT